MHVCVGLYEHAFEWYMSAVLAHAYVSSCEYIYA